MTKIKLCLSPVIARNLQEFKALKSIRHRKINLKLNTPKQRQETQKEISVARVLAHRKEVEKSSKGICNRNLRISKAEKFLSLKIPKTKNF